jgi:hypothetical protein
VAEGDDERVWLLLDELEGDLDVAEREGADHRRHVDHVCAVCESDCGRVTALRREVVLLENALLVAAYRLREARELRDFAREQIDRRFPEERAA